MRASRNIIGLTLLILSAITFGIWSAVTQADHRGALAVSFLDVGQGNATFIEAPSGLQVLIDGGPGASVLRALSHVMPWWDRSLDVVISTSGDRDDSTGLVDVLGRFRVAFVMRSSVSGSDVFARALSDAIQEAVANGAHVSTAKRGQVIDIGGGAYIEILSPDRDVSGADAASGCTVARLIYGATSFMLPCDAPQALENYLAYLDGTALRSDVLEIGHGGAKTSSSPIFVGYVAPAYAVYSRDCKNAPAEETAATLARFNVEAFDTCVNGTVTFTSDGKTVRVR